MNPLSLEKVLWIKRGEGIAAMGRIPQQSEFFQDHFPSFPVLPGVLALEMLKKTAEHYLQTLAETQTQHYFLKEIRATKFSIYLKPGDEWESQLELVSENQGETHWNARLMHKGQVAVTAKLTLALAHPQPNLVNH